MSSELILFISLLIAMIYLMAMANDQPLDCNYCCPYVDDSYLWCDDDFSVIMYLQKCKNECEC